MSNVEGMDGHGDGSSAGDTTDAKPFGKLLDSKTRPSVPAAPTPAVSRPIQESASDSEEYSMTYARRGIAIIVNNHTFEAHTKMPDRAGTDVDARSLQQRFRELDFEVFLFNNVKRKHLGKIIHDASKTNHSDCDCFCMIILTHGEEGVIYATDGTIDINDVFEPFKGNNCASLIGKPKLFFIQACRGTKLDDGVEWSDGVMDIEMCDAAAPKIPSEADFLLSYSVVPGYFSWRNSSNGSWFAQALSEVLGKHGTSMDLLRMMTRVNKKVAYDFESNATRAHMTNKKQIPCITSMLTKDVYFRAK